MNISISHTKVVEPGCAASQLHSGHAHCFEDWLARSVPITAKITCIRHFFVRGAPSLIFHLFNLLRSGTCPVCREVLADDDDEEEEEAGGEDVRDAAGGDEEEAFGQS